MSERVSRTYRGYRVVAEETERGCVGKSWHGGAPIHEISGATLTEVVSRLKHGIDRRIEAEAIDPLKAPIGQIKRALEMIELDDEELWMLEAVSQAPAHTMMLHKIAHAGGFANDNKALKALIRMAKRYCNALPCIPPKTRKVPNQRAPVDDGWDDDNGVVAGPVKLAIPKTRLTPDYMGALGRVHGHSLTLHPNVAEAVDAL